jgi:protein-L-isoaspartate O-methyltransferase
MGFNISAPHMYAVCLENLDIQEGMSFLDVGSGCGHFTVIAGYLVGKVMV